MPGPYLQTGLSRVLKEKALQDQTPFLKCHIWTQDLIHEWTAINFSFLYPIMAQEDNPILTVKYFYFCRVS